MKKNKLEIRTDNLYLVDVRFYNKANGVEVISDRKMSKAVVFENEGYYYDVITGEIAPLLERVPYSNVSKGGADFGTKLVVVNTDLIEDEGICYIKSHDQSFVQDLKKTSRVEYAKLEDMILYSDKFFLARREIVQDRIGKTKTRFSKDKLFRILESDLQNNLYYRLRMRDIRKNKLKKVLNLKIG